MKINFWLLSGIFFLFFSCRSVSKLAVRENDIPDISENKLMRNIAINELSYSSIYAKRVDVILKNGKISNNLKVSFKIERDSFMQFSVNGPMGIELARVLLTPDSIKFVNIYQKKYFISDYTYFYDKYDIQLSYDCIQSILTNVFFNFEKCGDGNGRVRKFRLDRTDEGYELFTLEEKTINRKIKKLNKKKSKNKDFMLVLQKTMIDPRIFRPKSMSIEDVEEKVGLEVDYLDFKEFYGRIFPGRIVLKIYSEQNNSSVELRFQKIEFDVPVESNLRISSKYKRM